MLNKKLRLIKLKHWLKKYFYLYIKETLSPFINKDGFIKFITSTIFLYLIFSYYGKDAMFKESEDMYYWIESSLYAFFFWAIINIFFSIFKVVKQEKSLGGWFENRFEYHQKQLILTTLVSPKKENQHFDFKVKDAENDVLVNFIAEIDGRRDLIKYAIDFANSSKPMFGCRDTSVKIGLRLKNKKGRLFIQIAKNSVPIKFNLYVTSWQV